MDKNSIEEKIDNLEFNLPIKKIHTLLFLIILCIPILNIIYLFVWLKRIYKALRIQGFWCIVIFYFILLISYLYIDVSGILEQYLNRLYFDLPTILFGLFWLGVSVFTIDKIQKYAKLHYKINLEINAFGIYFLSVLYVNQVINSFSDRCKKVYLAKMAKERIQKTKKDANI